MAYTKLWHKIVTSSIWDADNETRILWITMLALANRDGYVEASKKSLALLSRIADPQCDHALAVLLSPDPESRTKTEDGRRIESVDGGWMILNYQLYRDATSDDPHSVSARERQRIHRGNMKLRDCHTTSRDTASASESASADESSLSEGGCKGETRFDEFWIEWPKHFRKADRKKCEAKWRSEKLDTIADKIMASVKAWKSSKQWQKDGGQFIPAPLVWLNKATWEVELSAIETTSDDPSRYHSADDPLNKEVSIEQ